MQQCQDGPDMDAAEALAEQIESEGSSAERRKKIDALGRMGDSDATRLLVTLYHRSMWRETRIDIIRALGYCNNDRSLEFLITTARDQSDLQLAGEAVLAIGQTNNPLGGEVLLSFLDDKAHPLVREAVISLSNMRLFPCDKAFLRLLTTGDDPGPTVTQFLIIGLGRKARGGTWPVIEGFLDPEKFAPQVFNAALLAAGKLGRSEALKKLSAIDTRYRFFANQLKLASMEQIHYRLGSSFEDIYGTILASSDPSTAISTLRQYPHDDAWEAFTILGEDATAEVSATVRLALSDRSRAKEDLGYVAARADISPALRAAVYREYLDLAEAETLAAFKASSHSLDICQSVHHPELVNWLIDDGNQKAHSIAGINAMVAQCHMRPELKDRIGPLLVKRVGQYDSLLRQRVLRAIGQIRYDHPSAYTCLTQFLKTEDYSSVISAYGMLHSDEAQAAITKQLKQLAPDGESDKLKLLVSRLAKFQATKPEVLTRFLGNPDVRDDILKVLAGSTLADDAALSLVSSALDATQHQTRMLAIAAAKTHFNDEIIGKIWQHFTAVIPGTESCRFRALDTLCHLQHGPTHLKLIDALKDAEHAVIEKSVRSLVPVPGFDYKPAVKSLTLLMKNRPDLSAHSELSNAVSNLIENLTLKADGETTEVADTGHPVDTELTVLFPAFRRLSAGSRAALRNAELTHSQEDVFNDMVDKSTVLIEYVKCIDLQFQEKIGTKMFLGSGRLVDDMRTRILQLGLDEDNQTQATLIEALQCSRQFPATDFPSHKLFTMSQAFLNGKIAREQYKVIDGLRAWGLILLLFGRTFTFRGKQVTPVLQVLDSSNPVIAQLAADLNNLQELRNLAAHRGTLVARSQVEDLRKASIDCLNRTLQVIG
jgi:hypothetical protein